MMMNWGGSSVVMVSRCDWVCGTGDTTSSATTKPLHQGGTAGGSCGSGYVTSHFGMLKKYSKSGKEVLFAISLLLSGKETASHLIISFSLVCNRQVVRTCTCSNQRRRSNGEGCSTFTRLLEDGV